jgi:aspartyl-tRNA(Asn)/glutamyl-tRNA(Gln) amidotransferase subunit B
VAYAKTLHALVRWIGICDGNMQEGSFRCDANVSVRRRGSQVLGTRSEIKNLNSFRFLEEAINYEVRRQIELLEDGGTVVQETRLYDPDRKETRSMRSKEDAHDYRYFPDPDLLPLEVSASWLEEVRASLPELPQAKRERYLREFELSAYDAALLTSSREVADFFEDLIRALGGGYKLASSWITGELFGALKRAGLEISQSPIGSRQLAGLLLQIQSGIISGKTAKDVFDAMWNGEGEAEAIIAAKGLTQISDAGELERVIDGVLAANPKSVEEYRAGKEKAFNALVGQAMKATRGKGNPAQINEILKKKLAG